MLKLENHLVISVRHETEDKRDGSDKDGSEDEYDFVVFTRQIGDAHDPALDASSIVIEAVDLIEVAESIYVAVEGVAADEAT
ncbi:hypothetical protein DPMN_186317 [Dreissena polymorpha]|uniref:Uncharacterized protein n=1 Tax=Dreissena polymorpha TaxID=45954 RepID=A0A9D4I989_DREPO|nr:hypothetical protein DPMN_186317 [Dreissena polymorpha]